MQITPIYRHAAMRLPALTSLFSDAFTVTEIDVVKDDTTTFTAAGHGVTIGESIAIAVTDAPFPNPITAVEQVAGSTTDWKVTTQHDHDLTTTPDVNIAQAWNETALLDGFTDAKWNGAVELLSAPDRNTFYVRIASGASGTLNSNEVQLRNLEFEMVGWHKVTAADANTLTMPTPANVLRSYTVTDPTVVRNLRIMGAVTLDMVMKKYVLDDASIDDNTIFIVPRQSARVRSKHGEMRTQAPFAYHARLEDGFDVLALLPAHESSGGVAPFDLANGDVLRAVLRTFNGLTLPRPELGCGTTYGAFIEEHGMVEHNGPTYVHQYSFSANADLSQDDTILPYEAALLPALGSTSVSRVGAPAFRDVSFSGVAINGEPGLLTLAIELDN